MNWPIPSRQWLESTSEPDEDPGRKVDANSGQVVKVEGEHDHVQFDVFVRSGDETKKFKIDALSGKVP